MRSRGYCFTINNFTDDDIVYVMSLYDDNSADYLVAGFETGESGTPHIQGYVHFPNAVKFDSLKSIIYGAHIEQANGTPQQASDYCKKDDDYYECGKVPKSGKRTDLDEMFKKVLKVPLKEFARENPSQYARYHNGIRALKSVLTEDSVFSIRLFRGSNPMSHFKNTVEYINEKLCDDPSIDFAKCTNEKPIVFMYYQNAYYQLLEKLLYGIPIDVKVGFQWTKFLPKTIILHIDTNVHDLDQFEDITLPDGYTLENDIIKSPPSLD